MCPSLVNYRNSCEDETHHTRYRLHRSNIEINLVISRKNIEYFPSDEAVPVSSGLINRSSFFETSRNPMPEELILPERQVK